MQGVRFDPKPSQDGEKDKKKKKKSEKKIVVGAGFEPTTLFQTLSLSVAMETSGQLLPNFKLIQAFMHVLFACKYEKDQIRNSREM